MSFTRRIGRSGSGRGRLSLRSRLLAGLITVTALFLIIMGVVTTVVLGNTEQDQFDTDLALTARIKLSEVAALQGGYAIAYYNTATRSVGVLSLAVGRHDRAGRSSSTTWRPPADVQDFRTQTPRGPAVQHRAAGRAGHDRDLAAGHRRARRRAVTGPCPRARASWSSRGRTARWAARSAGWSPPS